MKPLNNAKKGAIWNSLGSTMYAANTFLMLTLVGRMSSVEDAGAFGIAYTTAQLLYIVGLFGVSHLQMTDYTRHYLFRDYRHMRGLSILIMLVACAGACLILQFQGDKLIFTVLLTIFMVINVVGDLYQNLFFQNNRLDLSGSALFFRTLWPVCMFGAVLFFTTSIVLALLAQILCNFVVTLYYILHVAPPFLTLEPSPASYHSKIKELFYGSLPLFAGSVLMNFVINSSKYAIEFLMDDTAQGYYNMIFFPAFVICLCSQFLFRPLLNGYAQLLQGQQFQRFGRKLLLQIGLIGLLTLVCCGGAALLGTPVLSLLFNKDLSSFLVPLVLVVMGGGVYATCDFLYFICVMIQKKRIIFLLYTCAAILTFPVTISLVNVLGITGAALSFAIMHAFILGCYAIYLFSWLRSQIHS